MASTPKADERLAEHEHLSLWRCSGCDVVCRGHDELQHRDTCSQPSKDAWVAVSFGQYLLMTSEMRKLLERPRSKR